MNEIVVHVGIIDRFMRDPNGPVGKDLFRRADRVERIAFANTSGPVLSRQSGDLQDHLDIEITQDGEGLRADIGTTAIHDEFGYPRFHDREPPAGASGRRWLTHALRDGLNH